MTVAKQKEKAARTGSGFTPEERAAMKERARELKADASKADAEAALLAKIAEMPDPDRSIPRLELVGAPEEADDLASGRSAPW